MNIPEKIWSLVHWVFILVIICLAIGALIGLKVFSSSDIDSHNQTPATISVDGTGEAFAVPDVATFSFSVSETAKTVTIAQTTATTKINTVLKSVRDAGVADKDIQTTSYNVNPHYEYQNSICPTKARVDGTPLYCPPGKSVLTGYDVSQTITVKIRDLNKAGEIFATIGSQGVDNVNGLNFGIDKPDTIRAEARAKAIAEAQEKAEILAKQLDVRLVKVISFVESGGYNPRPIMYSMDSVSNAGAKMAAPEIPVGEDKVSSTVTITYEIR